MQLPITGPAGRGLPLAELAELCEETERRYS